MRALWLLAGAVVGIVFGRMSAPENEPAPAAVERPAMTAATTTAAPAAPLAPPACPPAAVQAAADAGSAEVARAEREALARDAEAKAAAVKAAQDKLARASDPQLKSELIREITAYKSQDDLGSAWGWVAQHRADPGYAENVRNVLFQWSYDKPEHVAALLPQVASPEAQAAAAHQLAQLWNKKDPHAYQAWVASLPEGPLKAAARTPY